MRKFSILILGILLAMCTSDKKTTEKQESGVQIMTDKGMIEGKHDAKKALNIFLGVPYAKPPVGDLRWKAPQPMDSWEDVKMAKDFGPRAVQTNYWGDMVYRSNGMSEDCLYLNIWAPDALTDWPVLIYIYGGGFVAGDASEPRYDGQSMASTGMVVVSMNYRLNIFGFLAHPELSSEAPYGSSGNYGLLDQQAAIKWVKDNIAAFGGDPNKITIAGESAGSISVSSHVVSPLSRDMLAGAIGESGAAIYPTLYPVPLREAEKTGKDFAESAGYNSIEELRALSTDEIFKVYTDSKRFGFPTVIDGYFLPRSLPEMYKAGEFANIPLLVGWNSAESDGRAFMQGKAYTPENYKARVKEAYPKDYAKILKLYPGNTEEEVVQSATALASDNFISYATWKWWDLHLKNVFAKPVYRYMFSKIRPPLATQGTEAGQNPVGAPHASEIPYCLGNLPLVTEYAWTDEDYQVSETMKGYFSSFIKYGQPNVNGLPEWSASNPSWHEQDVMVIDVESKNVVSEVEERYQFLDKYFGN